MVIWMNTHSTESLHLPGPSQNTTVALTKSPKAQDCEPGYKLHFLIYSVEVRRAHPPAMAWPPREKRCEITFMYLYIFNLIFSGLLRYTWPTTIGKFKVYNMLIWYILNILQNVNHCSISCNTSMTSHNCHFFLVVITFRIYSLSTFQLYIIPFNYL